METPSELEAALAKARAAADELQNLDDKLTELIPDVEEALHGLRLGVRLSVSIQTGPWEKYLAFDKHGTKWRLLLSQGPSETHGGDPEDWRETLLANAPRDDRALVFEHYLEDLVLSAAKQIKAKTKQRLDAIDATKTLVSTLKRSQGGKP